MEIVKYTTAAKPSDKKSATPFSKRNIFFCFISTNIKRERQGQDRHGLRKEENGIVENGSPFGFTNQRCWLLQKRSFLVWDL